MNTQLYHWLKLQIDPVSVVQNQALGYTEPTAAVLVPLHADSTGQINVVVIERAMHLRHHPGQIALPGGKCDATDFSFVHTALREAHEEIGLDPKAVSIAGVTSGCVTTSGFNVLPVIGVIQTKQPLVANPDEVASISEIPLSLLMDKANHDFRVVSLGNGEITPCKVKVITACGITIWGATARMLCGLFDQIQWQLPELALDTTA